MLATASRGADLPDDSPFKEMMGILVRYETTEELLARLLDTFGEQDGAWSSLLVKPRLMRLAVLAFRRALPLDERDTFADGTHGLKVAKRTLGTLCNGLINSAAMTSRESQDTFLSAVAEKTLDELSTHEARLSQYLRETFSEATRAALNLLIVIFSTRVPISQPATQPAKRTRRSVDPDERTLEGLYWMR